MKCEKIEKKSNIIKLKLLGFILYYWLRPFYHYIDLISDIMVTI